jgi:hypothetical protein
MLLCLNKRLRQQSSGSPQTVGRFRLHIRICPFPLLAQAATATKNAAVIGSA